MNRIDELRNKEQKLEQIIFLEDMQECNTLKSILLKK